MLANGIFKTETGALPPESTCLPTFRVAWTNTDILGEEPNLGTDCGGWEDPLQVGKTGRLGYPASTWTDSATLDCTCLASLYCVEQ